MKYVLITLAAFLVLGGGYAAYKNAELKKMAQFENMAATTEVGNADVTATATVETKTSTITKTTTTVRSADITLKDDGSNSGSGILSGATKVSSGATIRLAWDFGTRDAVVRKAESRFSVVFSDEINCPPCPAGAPGCVCLGSNKSYVMADNRAGSSAEFKAGFDVNGNPIPLGSYVVRISASGGSEWYLSSGTRIQIVK